MILVPVLHNIRSTYNVGAILRTAEGFGVRTVLCSGYTPRYHDQELLPHLREKLDHAIEKTALGAEKLVKLETTDDIQIKLREFRTNGFLVVGLENNLSVARLRERLLELKPENLLGIRAALRGKDIALILGEEVAGIPSELHEQMDYFLEIPMKGKKESFNVAIATGIALFMLSSMMSE